MRWTVLTLLMFVAGCGAADRSAEIRQCWDLTQAGADPNLRVQECTRAIASGLLTDQGVAQAYNNRGVAYRALEDLARAIADFDAALRLEPGYGMAHYNRGLSYGGLGDYDRAIADFAAALSSAPYNSDSSYQSDALKGRAQAYAGKGEYERAFADWDQALRLNPDNLSARDDRAHGSLVVGRFAAAADDFADLLAVDPTNHYLALHLYVARERAKEGGLAELRANARRLNLSAWPGPLVRLYLGEIGLPEAEQATTEAVGDPAKWCHFHMFSAQWLIIHGEERQKIVETLRQGLDSCDPATRAHAVVQAELQRMGSD